MLICVDTRLTHWGIQPASIGFNPCHPPAPYPPILARPGFIRLVHFCPNLPKARRSGRSDFLADLSKPVKNLPPSNKHMIPRPAFAILISPESEQVVCQKGANSRLINIEFFDVAVER